MKKILSLSLAALLLSSCSYRQYDSVLTGSTLGGLFGSAIGGILGGPEGHDKGTVVGMVAGAVTGAVIANESEKKAAERYQQPNTRYQDEGYYYDNTVSYGRSERYDYESMSQWADLEITNVEFKDQNGNRALDPNEEAFITFDIRNRGRQTLYNVAPRITVNDSRISISPVAIISTLPAGRGVRYKAICRAKRSLRNGDAVFTVSFGNGRNAYTAKTFRIRTRR